MGTKQSCVERQYCVGCGLCKSYFGETNVKLDLDKNGFYVPEFNLSNNQLKELSDFCPADIPPKISRHTWGESLRVCLGYSSDDVLRNRASSGGILSALCMYVLQNNLAEGIIQLGDSSVPMKKTSRISHCMEEIAACAGSRYIAALPLEHVTDFFNENPDARFVIVGRPCDIRAMRAFLNGHKEYEKRIVFMLSFFCAGTPSINASKRMISQMGADPQDIEYISYRGNGWPGYATVKDSSGNTYTMPYEDSWGRILGRDIYRGCRFCYDGIGEAADISCGDAWYLDSDGRISFEERPGRNVIFARTENGEALLRQAEKDGCVICQPFDVSDLKKMQPYQYARKAQLYYKLLAMRTMHRVIPAIDMRALKKYRGCLSIKQRAKIYLGTLRRIVQKKI